MRFTLPDAYADFFSKHRIIELENILTEEQADFLKQKMESSLEKKMRGKPLILASNQEICNASHLLYLEGEIKTALFRLRLGEIAHFFFRKRPLRLVYATPLFVEKAEDAAFPSQASLEKITSASPILGGALIYLDRLQATEEEPSAIPNPLSSQKGNVIFFGPEVPLPFEALFKAKGARLILLCFAPQQVRYKLETKDPNTHLLKKDGYVFGDLLEEDVCPYIYY
jgi:hypothetical protein